MTKILWGGRVRGLFADIKGPWGTKSGSGGGTGGGKPPSGGEGGGEPPSDGDGGGPWGQPGQPGRRGRRIVGDSGNVTSLEDLL
ncbi:MAG: hypothetical protein ABIS38_01190, partial [Sphingomicrobium sp.]